MCWLRARLAAAKNAEIKARQAQAQADAEAFRMRLQEEAQGLAREKFLDSMKMRNSPPRVESVDVGGKTRYFVRNPNGSVSWISTGEEVEQRMSLPQVLMYNGGMVPLYIEDSIYGKKPNPEYVEAARVVLGELPEYQFLLNGLNQSRLNGPLGESDTNGKKEAFNGAKGIF